MQSELVGLGGWIKNSLIDYPGTVSTVLFFCGCNLRCPFCHNRDLVEYECPPSVSSAGVWGFLEKRRGLIDGVVISGGEPTIHPHLGKVIADIHALGYKVKLDTNGLLPEIAESFAPDYIALDIKTVPSRYRAMLSAPFDDIKKRLECSIDLVRRMGDRAEIRITVAPGFVDTDVIKELVPMLSGVRKVMLQPMNQNVMLLDPVYNTLPPVPMAEIVSMRDILAEFTGKCGIRGE